jgi:hypothetical protein
MGMRLAPIHINFMLVCYFSAEPEQALGKYHWDSMAGREARLWLHKNELIDSYNRSTERGRAWVDFICETPLPEAKWVMPERTKS